MSGGAMKARVRVIVSAPLEDVFRLSLPMGKRIWVEFKNERLPDFYYICGRLDHSEKDCKIELEVRHEGVEVKRKFDSSLRSKTYTPPEGFSVLATSSAGYRRVESEDSASTSGRSSTAVLGMERGAAMPSYLALVAVGEAILEVAEFLVIDLLL